MKKALILILFLFCQSSFGISKTVLNTLTVDGTLQRVGVGTTEPTQTLDVSGTANMSAITTSRLGIQTSTPIAPFHIDGTGSTCYMRFANSSTGRLATDGTYFGIIGDDSFLFEHYESGKNIALKTNSGSVAVTGGLSVSGQSSVSGYLGIQTSTPIAPFHIDGQADTCFGRFANSSTGRTATDGTYFGLISDDSFLLENYELGKNIALKTNSGTVAITGGLSTSGGIDAGANGTSIERLIVPIDSWDMDADANKSVNYGVTLDPAKITSIRVMIVNDAGTISSPLEIDPGGDQQGGFWSAGATAIGLNRIAATDYDSVNYDSSFIPRGFVTIEYTN